MKRIFTLLMVLILTGCSAGNYQNISAQDAKNLINQDKVTIIDVRTPEEYNSGHIPGAKLIPLQIIEGQAEKLSKDKSYLLVCHSGNRSTQASEILKEKGFKHIYNMTGGMNNWTYDIEK